MRKLVVYCLVVSVILWLCLAEDCHVSEIEPDPVIDDLDGGPDGVIEPDPAFDEAMEALRLLKAQLLESNRIEMEHANKEGFYHLSFIYSNASIWLADGLPVEEE
jgi:hypothetical protein